MQLIEFDFVKIEDAAKIMCCHPETINSSRKNKGWLEGIHYVRLGKKILYNRQLLLNLVQCGGEVMSVEHQNAIAVYLANRLDNQPLGRRKQPRFDWINPLANAQQTAPQSWEKSQGGRR